MHRYNLQSLIGSILYGAFTALLSGELSQAAVFRVPADYSTIQAAVNAASDNDSVLVASDVYQESVSIVSRNIFLLGDVADDSTESARPVIDPSTLSEPAIQKCLLVSGAIVTCEDFTFRNGAAMYPRESERVGGVQNDGTLVVRRCLFDSTHIALRSWNHPITVENSRFHDVQYRGLISNSQVTCVRSEFSGRGVDALARGGSLSYFLDCHFHTKVGTGPYLYLNGSDIVVEECEFGPNAFYLNHGVTGTVPNGILRRNRFHDFGVGLGVVWLDCRCDSPTVVQDNRFEDLNLSSGGEGVTVLGFDGLIGEPCNGAVVENNIIADIQGGALTPAITLFVSAVVTHNWLLNIQETEVGMIRVYSPQTTFRENRFDLSGYILERNVDFGGDFSVDAMSNWWGHSSGPQHPTENPLGLGGTVSSGVEFRPWHMDTSFWDNWNSAEDASIFVPASFELTAFPNPFNSSMTIHLTASQRQYTDVFLYNTLGQKIANVWQGVLTKDKPTIVRWDGVNNFGRQVASGVYYVVAQPRGSAGGAPKAQKAVLLR